MQLKPSHRWRPFWFILLIMQSDNVCNYWSNGCLLLCLHLIVAWKPLEPQTSKLWGRCARHLASVGQRHLTFVLLIFYWAATFANFWFNGYNSFLLCHYWFWNLKKIKRQSGKKKKKKRNACAVNVSIRQIVPWNFGWTPNCGFDFDCRIHLINPFDSMIRYCAEPLLLLIQGHRRTIQAREVVASSRRQQKVGR